MAKPLRSFVEYALSGKNKVVVHEVSDRDVKKLTFPPDAYQFYFFDSATTSQNPYDAQNDQTHCSAFYTIATRIISRDEARKLRKIPRSPRGKDAHKPVALGMTPAQIREAFWEASLKLHDTFAVTPQGNIKAVRKDDIVVNEKGDQLYPVPFSPALTEDTAVIKMPRPRPRK